MNSHGYYSLVTTGCESDFVSALCFVFTTPFPSPLQKSMDFLTENVSSMFLNLKTEVFLNFSLKQNLMLYNPA